MNGVRQFYLFITCSVSQLPTLNTTNHDVQISHCEEEDDDNDNHDERSYLIL